MKPGMAARVYVGSGAPLIAQASSVSCQTIATRSDGVDAGGAFALASEAFSVSFAPGQ